MEGTVPVSISVDGDRPWDDSDEFVRLVRRSIDHVPIFVNPSNMDDQEPVRARPEDDILRFLVGEAIRDGRP